jgi:hypothetical protein
MESPDKNAPTKAEYTFPVPGTRKSHSFVGASWYYDYNIEHMFLSRGKAANQRDFIVLTCGVRLMEVVKETQCSNQYCNFVCPHAWQGQHKA